LASVCGAAGVIGFGRHFGAHLMKSPQKKMTTNTDSAPRDKEKHATGTRDAVETAIGLAKSHTSLSWDQQLEKTSGRITPWPS